jgi:hypothetical protein
LIYKGVTIMSQELERLRRKRDQAYELAGLAREDGDKIDELRWLKEAKEYEAKIRDSS